MELSDLEITFKEDLEEQEDIARCLRTLILTPAGTIPLCRDFGIDNSFLGRPIPAAQNALAVEIMDKAAIYEPRVTVTEVTSEADIDGKITVKVVCSSG